MNYTPKQLAFISARKYLSQEMLQMGLSLRQQGYPDSNVNSRICAADGSELSEENQRQIDGQGLCFSFEFDHQSSGLHHIYLTISNTDEWLVTVRINSSVTPEMIEVISETGEGDAESAVRRIQNIFIGILEGIQQGWLKRDR